MWSLGASECARGLQTNCKGSSHSGYQIQRSRSKRGLFPEHNLGTATVGIPFGPTEETNVVWSPLLGCGPVGGGAGGDVGPNSVAVEALVAAAVGPLPTSAVAELPSLSPHSLAHSLSHASGGTRQQTPGCQRKRACPCPWQDITTAQTRMGTGRLHNALKKDPLTWRSGRSSRY